MAVAGWLYSPACGRRREGLESRARRQDVERGNSTARAVEKNERGERRRTKDEATASGLGYGWKLNAADWGLGTERAERGGSW
ncbi:hypothetical protein VCV18_010495 [Metarhizium anisopliae]